MSYRNVVRHFMCDTVGAHVAHAPTAGLLHRRATG